MAQPKLQSLGTPVHSAKRSCVKLQQTHALSQSPLQCQAQLGFLIFKRNTQTDFLT
jgi:hypothetical protein